MAATQCTIFCREVTRCFNDHSRVPDEVVEGGLGRRDGGGGGVRGGRAGRGLVGHRAPDQRGIQGPRAPDGPLVTLLLELHPLLELRRQEAGHGAARAESPPGRGTGRRGGEDTVALAPAF